MGAFKQLQIEQIEAGEPEPDQPECSTCNDTGTDDGVLCQECCEHSNVDHFECLDCGKQLDPGEAIDAAERDYDR